MNDQDRKKFYKLTSLFIRMILLIGVFFWVLINLNGLETGRLLAIIVFIWLLFVYLGAKLILVISQMYFKSYDMSINDDIIEKHRAKSDLVNKVEENLTKDGFEKVELTNSAKLRNVDICYLKKIKYDKGMYIDDVFIIKDLVSLDQEKLFDEILKNSVNKNKGMKNFVLRQKCVFLCVFSSEKMNEDIRNFIAKFNYFSYIFVPVFIDSSREEVYYNRIPINKGFAKGKALVHSRQLIIKYLCQ